MIVRALLLTFIKKFNGERTSSAIYHIITGKRSIQSIQDIHMYQLTPFYSIAKHLTKTEFIAEIEQLKEQQLIIGGVNEKGNSINFISDLGKEWLDKNLCLARLYYFNGLSYHSVSYKFYLRFALLIQTFTNTTMNHFSFLPVVTDVDVEKWVKKLYGNPDYQSHEILSIVYPEFKQMLLHFTDEEANIFLDRLTGYQQYGLSIDQLARKYKKTHLEIQLLLTGIIHYMLQIITEKREEFPFLTYMITDIQSENILLTNTAMITNKLLHQGYSINEIANIRRLKFNTIYDHIVEIAIHDPEFPVEKYVGKETKQAILQAIQQTNSLKLKDIKENTNVEVSYFEIRLVLSLLKNPIQLGDKGE